MRTLTLCASALFDPDVRGRASFMKLMQHMLVLSHQTLRARFDGGGPPRPAARSPTPRPERASLRVEACPTRRAARGNRGGRLAEAYERHHCCAAAPTRAPECSHPRSPFLFHTAHLHSTSSSERGLTDLRTVGPETAAWPLASGASGLARASRGTAAAQVL